MDALSQLAGAFQALFHEPSLKSLYAQEAIGSKLYV